MLILIVGIHGSGKSYFCEKYAEYNPVLYLSASKLISKHRKKLDLLKNWNDKKIVKDSKSNQNYLEYEILKYKNNGNKNIILDGHMALLGPGSEILNIPKSFFKKINPNGIILIERNLDDLKKYYKQKKINVDIDAFMKNERESVIDIADFLNIERKILISPTFFDFSIALRAFF